MADFNEMKILQCRSGRELDEALGKNLAAFGHLFPRTRDARILLKPNLNSNMNALTGNTTDLRLLAAFIRYLKERGYRDILIGEGTNSGFYRNRIGVITRLKVDRLAEYYGICVKDFNEADSYDVELSGGVKAQVAKECMEADLFVNFPKLKTHFEVGMSVCLKNLMGCLVGQENKKKMHLNLAENIIRLNQQIRPHLHIVDALVAMEGLGPTRGTPVRMDLVLIGTDPYLIDLACASIAGFDYRTIRTLLRAEENGFLTPAHHRIVNTLDAEATRCSLKPPEPGPLAAFIHSPGRQRFFLRIRNTSFFNYLCSTDWFGRLLFLTGLRQDVFLREELRCDELHVQQETCDGCGLCGDLCPIDLHLPEALADPNNGCLKCLYCYSVCAKKAIQFNGRLGFYSEQIRQYDPLIRNLYKKPDSE